MNCRWLLTRNLLVIALLANCVSIPLQAAEDPAAGKQVEQTLTHADGHLGYLLYLPAEYEQDDNKSWPVVLFLHGRGESNGPLSLVAKWGPPRYAARGDDLPFILVSPQCPRNGQWSDEVRQDQLDALLGHVTQSYRVDEQRIYVTGLSMGGYGSWTLAARTPERFAAVVPVCGGGDPNDADKLKSLPIWVFHGDQDRAVPYSRSVEMVDAIRAAGSNSIRFTSLEHIGHNCWSATYATPELYSWMLQQRRKQQR
jgi:predicted peptidase